MVSSTGKRSLPSRARRARSPRSRPAWAKRLAPHQHRRQKCHEGGGGINPIGPVPLDRHVAPNLPSQIDLSQAGNEDGHAAEGSDCPFGLAQNQPLVRQQRSDPPRNGFVRGIGFHRSVVSKAYHPNEAQLRNSGSMSATRCSPSDSTTRSTTPGFAAMPRICSITACSIAGADTERVGHWL
jgi:hypothetical protein